MYIGFKHCRFYERLKKRRNQLFNLVGGIETVRQRPVFIVGLPRSGTTWIASVISTAHAVKYFHEPFNCSNVSAASQFCMKYLTKAHDDLEFARHCREAFHGEVIAESVRAMLPPIYRRYPKLPARVVVKDVCSCLAVECVESLFNPMTVLVIRHPCAVAASWHRLNYDVDRHLQAIRTQPQLNQNILQGFESVLKDAEGFWEKIGAVWGAVYYVLFQQQKRRPNWQIVQHEAFCQNPVAKFRRLFEVLDLRWTDTTEALLCESTKIDNRNPYSTQRISGNEPDKWQKLLSKQQINGVLKSVQAFGIPLCHS